MALLFLRLKIPLAAALLFLLFVPVSSGAQESGEDAMFSEDGETVTPPDESVFLNPFADTADEESAKTDDYDSMFQEGMIEEINKDTQNSAPEDDLLKSELVRWGGKFTGNVTTDHLWEKYHDEFDLANPTDAAITVDAKADLFFDARPLKDFRVFGKLKIEAAQAANINVLPEEGINLRPATDSSGNTTLTVPGNQENAQPGDINITNEDLQGNQNTGFTITVHELFSDFSFKNRLFFRFGKHTIKWGVGYFWSPADVLNLTSINVEDPTADREGPISLKTQFPFGAHNAYFFVIAPPGITHPNQIGVAPKIEFLIGNTELGFGGFYQKDSAAKLMATFDASVSDFKFFGEGVVGLGSDRIFVRKAVDQSAATDDTEDDFALALDTFKVTLLPYFWGTAGVLYFNDKQKLSIIGQYFYNGDGYGDSSLLEPAYYLLRNSASGNPDYNAEDDPAGDYEPPTLGTGDLANFGRHYIGVSVGLGEIFESDLGFATFWIGNMTDLSGIFSANFSYKLFDYFTLSAGMRLTYGGIVDEYTNPQALALGAVDRYGHTLAFTIGLNIGSGSF